jgi:hypothetical protein
MDIEFRSEEQETVVSRCSVISFLFGLNIDITDCMSGSAFGLPTFLRKVCSWYRQSYDVIIVKQPVECCV